MFQVMLPIIAPIFISVGLGWLWVKSGRSMDLTAVNMMVTNIGAPCLVFSSLARLTVSGAALTDMALATAVAVAGFMAIGAVILRLGKLSSATYLPSLVFTNCGNMGLPLSLFAFGQAGLDLAAAYFAVSMVVMMVLGVWLVSGEPTPKAALTMPLPYAVAAALGFRGAGVEVPAWLYNSTDLLGSMTVPLMLLTLGVSLASMRVKTFKRASVLATLRLAMGAAVGFALAEFFAFEGVARGVLIIQCTMPPAVFNYLFAQTYRREPEEVAGVIVLSTLISFATLPLLLSFILI
ncbi:MAG: AEC family transporter [Alphaproteobacteria bacterium]